MRPIETLGNKGIASALLEVVLIVFGILAALGLQGWWENRVERANLADYLVALEDEIVQNDTELDTYLQQHLQQLNRIDNVLVILADAARDVLPPNFQKDLGDIYWIVDPQLALAAYENMVSTGSLRLIRNTALRDSIAKYVDFISSADVIEEETWKNYYNYQFPFLVRHGVLSEQDLMEGYKNMTSISDDLWVTPTPKSRHSADAAAFESREFWNLLVGYKVAMFDQALGAVRGKEQIVETLELLRAEIERMR